jgi:hypothetical protein
MVAAHLRRALIGGAVLLAVAGCSNSAGESLVPVTGQVKVEGKLLTQGTVVLHADADKGNRTEHEPRGSFNKPGEPMEVRAGAPPGAYDLDLK